MGGDTTNASGVIVVSRKPDRSKDITIKTTYIPTKQKKTTPKLNMLFVKWLFLCGIGGRKTDVNEKMMLFDGFDDCFQSCLF